MTMECALFIFAWCNLHIAVMELCLFYLLAVYLNNCEDLYMLVLSNMPDPGGL